MVRTRLHTNAISEYLNNFKELEPLIKAVVLTGQGSTEENAMNDSAQKRNLDAFRNGEANVLVATDIAQEGLDVAECNYVIRYEFVSNEIGTVQSRGRARAKSGQLFLITEEKSLNEKREYENRFKEESMNVFLTKLNTI